MKELEVLRQALDGANRAGVFTLEQSAAIINSINMLVIKLQECDKCKTTPDEQEQGTDKK